MTEIQFRYFSSVEGALVPRFITFQSAVTQYIGAKRVGKTIEWDESAVVAIPEAEFIKYRREYNNAVKSKTLLVRTKAEHDAYLERGAAADKEVEEAIKKADEDRKAAEVQAAKAKATANEPTTTGAAPNAAGKGTKS